MRLAARQPQREAEAQASSVYARLVADYGAAVSGAVYDRLRQEADAGADEAALLLLLGALLAVYAAQRPARRERLAAAFTATLVAGYEAGAQTQLVRFASDAVFSLSDAGILRSLEAAAGGMAAYATLRLEGQLMLQTVRSAKAQEPAPVLSGNNLAGLNAAVVRARGENLGALAVALLSIAGGLKKTWKHVMMPGERRRDAHRQLENVSVKRGEFFVIPGGPRVRHPHDWELAGVDQWAWCSCYAIYTAEPGATITPWTGD